jgi:hypothetical protein
VDNTRVIEILKKEYYPSMGLIATIKFINNLLPKIGEIVRFELECYKIRGVLVTSSSRLINENYENDIYEYLIEEVK